MIPVTYDYDDYDVWYLEGWDEPIFTEDCDRDCMVCYPFY